MAVDLILTHRIGRYDTGPATSGTPVEWRGRRRITRQATAPVTRRRDQ
jgi:hypothetical protein